MFSYVGFLRVEKGTKELLGAFRKLTENGHSCRLLLVGDFYEENLLDQELLAWVKQSGQVIFTGRGSDPEHSFAAMDYLVILPIGRALAWCYRRQVPWVPPIITTDSNGPGEFIKNGTSGILVPPGNTEELYCQIVYILEHEEERQAFTEASYEEVCGYFDRTVMLQNILEDRNALCEKRLKKANATLRKLSQEGKDES